jgi:hypothetical protein
MNKIYWTGYLRIGIIVFLILSYALLVIIFATDSSESISTKNYVYLWIVGVVLYVLTILYATKVDRKGWVTTIIFISGSVWVFPPLMATYFGIPFLVVYPVITGWMISRK